MCGTGTSHSRLLREAGWLRAFTAASWLIVPAGRFRCVDFQYRFGTGLRLHCVVRPNPRTKVPSEPLLPQSLSGHDATQVTGKLLALKNIFYCRTSSFKTNRCCFGSRAHRVRCVKGDCCTPTCSTFELLPFGRISAGE